MKQQKRTYISNLILLAILLLAHPLLGSDMTGIAPRHDGRASATAKDSYIPGPATSSHSGERIFVHTDREIYIAGENIWFKAYLLDDKTERLTSTSNLAYVEILNSQNRPVMQKRIILEDGCGPGEAVLSDTLSSGSYLLRAYTGAMKSFMPDGCFMKRITIYNALRTETYLTAAGAGERSAGDPAANRGTTAMHVTGEPAAVRSLVEMDSPDSCRRREKVIIEFDVTAKGSPSAVPARLSLAVTPSTGARGPDIADWMQERSPGESHGMGSHDENLRQETTAEGMPAESLRFDFEKEYHFIQGRLFNRNTQMPDSGKYLFLSIPGKKAVFFYSRTDAEGRFSFSVPADRITRELIIQPEVVNTDNTIRIESSFSEEYPAHTPDGGTQPTGSPKLISLMKVNYQVNRIYEIENAVAPPPQTPQQPEKPAGSFYGIPDISLDLDEFIRLPVMTEVFYELVPGVTLRQKREGYELTVADPYYDVVYEQPPVTFIDGVVVSDPAVIAAFDPDHVERIDVIRDRYVVGDYLFFGLVNIITYDGDYSRVSLPDYAVRLPYRAADPVRTFMSPEYSTPERKGDRTPDFRNTLCWEPTVTPSSDGKYRVEFWSSDVPGDYEINLQGVTDDGHPVSFRKVFTVK